MRVNRKYEADSLTRGELPGELPGGLPGELPDGLRDELPDGLRGELPDGLPGRRMATEPAWPKWPS